MLDKISCRFEKVSNFGVGFAFMLIGFVFIIFGITLIPVIGFFLAIPAFIVAFLFFKAHRSEECAINN